MKKGTYLILCLALVCSAIVLTMSSSIFADDDGPTLCIPVGDITISAPESVEAKRLPVTFPHAAHFAYNCKECHHYWENDDSLQSCTAEGCHDYDESARINAKSKVDETDAILYYKEMYHTKCIGCHKDIKQANAKTSKAIRIVSKTPDMQPTGPTSCVKCHPVE